MFDSRSDRRHHQDRRWCSDRRARERRRGWLFDRRRRDLRVAIERRCGQERRRPIDRRASNDRRTALERRVPKVHLCQAALRDGGQCYRRAVLKSSATGDWHCLHHLSPSSPPGIEPAASAQAR